MDVNRFRHDDRGRASHLIASPRSREAAVVGPQVEGQARDSVTANGSARALRHIVFVVVLVMMGLAVPFQAAHADPAAVTDAASLAAALSAASPGDTVTLDGDVTVSPADVTGDALTVPAGIDVVIPSGAELSVAAGVTLAITAGATVTVDGDLDNNGTIDAAAGDTDGGAIDGTGQIGNHGVITSLVGVPAGMLVFGNHIVFAVDLAGGTGGPSDAQLYGPKNHAVYADVLSEARLPSWTAPTKDGGDGAPLAFLGWYTDGIFNPGGDIPVGRASIDGAAVTVQLTASWAPAFHAGGVVPDAYVGLPYSHQLAVTGGVPPYRWHFVGGIGCTPMPPGLTLSTSGLLSGIPTVAVGHCTMNVSVVDSATTGSYHPVTVTITVQATPPECTPAGFVAAFNAAADGSVVTLCTDLTLDTAGLGLVAPSGRHITLDLAGHTLVATGAGGAPALTVPADSSLTVIDTSAHLTGTATFDGIVDDGDLAIGGEHNRIVTVTSTGTISGTGSIDGYGTIANNGIILATVTVTGVKVLGHNYWIRIFQNDGTGRFLGNVRLFAPTLHDAGISIARDWSAFDYPGHTFTGWFTNDGGYGSPLSDDTDFSNGGQWLSTDGGLRVTTLWAGWTVTSPSTGTSTPTDTSTGTPMPTDTTTSTGTRTGTPTSTDTSTSTGARTGTPTSSATPTMSDTSAQTVASVPGGTSPTAGMSTSSQPSVRSTAPGGFATTGRSTAASGVATDAGSVTSVHRTSAAHDGDAAPTTSGQGQDATTVVLRGESAGSGDPDQTTADLAETGFDTGSALMAALALLVAGGVATAAVRRRPSQH